MAEVWVALDLAGAARAGAPAGGTAGHGQEADRLAGAAPAELSPALATADELAWKLSGKGLIAWLQADASTGGEREQVPAAP